LLLNVFDNYLIRHIAGTSHEVPACPYVTSPKRLAQRLEFHQQLAGCLPLDRLHQLAHRNMRRHRHKYMNMITRNITFYDFHIMRPANFSGQLSYPVSDVSSQNLLAVLSDPYNVIFYVVNGVARFPVVLHTASILKSSPEGEGFSPNPRWGQ